MAFPVPQQSKKALPAKNIVTTNSHHDSPSLLRQAAENASSPALTPKSPNFSVPANARFSPYRKRSLLGVIHQTDTDEVKELKHRLIIMASEEIQILKHPDDQDPVVESAKGSFRIEFDGIIACLDINWEHWEDDYLRPKVNLPFPEQACQKFARLPHSISSLRIKDENLGIRIKKLNRYNAVASKRGMTVGREIRELFTAARIATFGRATFLQKLQDVRDDSEGVWEGGKAEDFNFGLQQDQESEQDRWRGGEVKEFNFGF